ncbi:MAG TPA: class I SAM-dependent methyltransferase [Ktedonosporobacter sp.]|nr:class I SAM-dependent methyltransferase [Ktedonosporobacter sp.]
MDNYMKTNQDWWNEAAQVHAQGEGYQVKEFKKGLNKLHALERAEVGGVAGKKLLHLQCHFGLDTLSWARLGAQVTGVDFAEKAIAIAQDLSQELQLDATFVQSEIYQLPNVLDAEGAFDIVYTSYGAICWLPDLQPWGKIIAHYLKPGGFFYIAEGHPFMWTIDEKSPELKIGYPYFSKEPIKDDTSTGTYAEKEAKLEHNVTFGWNHTFSEIFGSLLSAGLAIDFFHEHPFCVWECLPDMEEVERNILRFKDEKKREMIPLMYSLKATKR